MNATTGTSWFGRTRLFRRTVHRFAAGAVAVVLMGAGTLSYAFEPHPITLSAGQPTRLLFVNRSNRGHNFTAPEFFAAAQILSGVAPGGKVNLASGESAAIELVPTRGRYTVHCGRFSHKWRGMKTEILVQ